MAGDPSTSEASRRAGARPELIAFAAFVIVACAPLALLVWRDLVNDWIWLGSDGGAAVQDQMQYVNWIRDAADNLLVSNHYRSEPGEASYLHPLTVLSGGLVNLGLAPKVAYLLWKPVAILALFLAITAYVRRLVPAGRARWAALALALFYLPPTVLLFGDDVDWTVTSGEMWPIDMLWGYYYSALGMAGLAAALLLYERDRRAGRLTLWAPLVGLLAGWLQPWAGALAVGIIAGSELVIVVLGRRGTLSIERPAGGRAPPDAGRHPRAARLLRGAREGRPQLVDRQRGRLVPRSALVGDRGAHRAARPAGAARLPGASAELPGGRGPRLAGGGARALLAAVRPLRRALRAARPALPGRAARDPGGAGARADRSGARSPRLCHRRPRGGPARGAGHRGPARGLPLEGVTERAAVTSSGRGERARSTTSTAAPLPARCSRPPRWAS